MDRIIINVVDKNTSFAKRIVLDINSILQQCDFVTIGDEIIFDSDTDFFTFGYDVTTGSRQLAIVTGEAHAMEPGELVKSLMDSVKERFDTVGEDETQIWLKEKSA